MATKLQRIIILAAALGPLAGAVQLLGAPHALNRRQAFDPDEETLPVGECSEIGPGYSECRAESALEPMLCIDPTQGETCCSNEWGCPAESFCLIEGLCCPEGLDPQTCAEQNDVVLPPDFGTDPTPTPDDTASVPESTPTATDDSSTTAPPEPTDSSDVIPPDASSTPDVPVPAAGSHKEVSVAGAVLGLMAFLL